MSLETDLLVDRRSLRRRLSLWRALAFLVLAVALVSAAVLAGAPRLQRSAAHVARVKVTGFIGDQTDTLKLFDRIADSGAKAVLVEIDSPGGATTGGEALYDGLRALSAKLPTVAVVDGLGASAAYMAAIGTDHIVARRTSLVGSIGVLVEYPNFHDLLDKVGVSVESVKSSPLKASPDGVTPTPPEARAALESLIADTFGWFKGLVKDRRHFDDATVTKVSDGRVYTGQQALGLHLIDEVGDEKTAVAWLEGQRGVPKDLPIQDWEREGAGGPFGLTRGAAALAQAAGLGPLAGLLGAGGQGPALDGLLSVWHPSLAQ